MQIVIAGSMLLLDHLVLLVVLIIGVRSRNLQKVAIGLLLIIHIIQPKQGEQCQHGRESFPECPHYM